MSTAEEEIAAEAAAEANLATQMKDMGTRVQGHLATMQAELDKAVAQGFQVSTALQNAINAMNADAAAAAALSPDTPAPAPPPAGTPATSTPVETPVPSEPPAPPATP